MAQTPTDRHYTSTHEWIKTEDDCLVVGITDHAQSLLGDLVYVELPEIGFAANTGKELGVLESVKAAADLYAPINGKVVDINEAVQQDPALVNQDPYQAGWLVKIEKGDDTSTLLDATQYEQLIKEDH